MLVVVTELWENPTQPDIINTQTLEQTINLK